MCRCLSKATQIKLSSSCADHCTSTSIRRNAMKTTPTSCEGCRVRPGHTHKLPRHFSRPTLYKERLLQVSLWRELKTLVDLSLSLSLPLSPSIFSHTVLTYCELHSIPASMCLLYSSSSQTEQERVMSFVPTLQHPLMAQGLPTRVNFTNSSLIMISFIIV